MRQLFVCLLAVFCIGNAVAVTSIGDISAFFCHDKSLVKNTSFFVKAGNTLPICLIFRNTSQEIITLDFSFVDGVKTNDQLNTKACSAQGGTFSQFVHFPVSRLAVFPQSFLSVTGTLKFPIGFSGQINGCLVYSLLQKKKAGSMFDVVIRKANFFDGWVIDNFKRTILLDSQKFFVFFTGKNQLSFFAPISNKGTIDETIEISGTISNVLGYQRYLLIKQTVAFGSSAVLQQTFDDIPFYKGWYVFSGIVTAKIGLQTGLFHGSDQNILNPKIISFSFSAFGMPRFLICIIAGIFLFVRIMYFIKLKFYKFKGL